MGKGNGERDGDICNMLFHQFLHAMKTTQWKGIFFPPDAHRMGGNNKNDNDRTMVDGPEEIKHPNRNESCLMCLSS